MAKRKRAQKRAEPKLVRPKPIDGHVGGRVRIRRLMLGISQQSLAARLGITFQQLQKNEKGSNRIGSSRLLELSQALDVPIQYFFDEMSSGMAATAGVKAHSVSAGPPDDLSQEMAKTETLKLVRAYYQIKDPRVRKRVYGLAKELAADSA